MNCCFKKHGEFEKQRVGKPKFVGDVITIEDINKKIGLGPSLYLMTVKSLCCFFFLITILNTPVYFFYYTAGKGFNSNSTATTNSTISTNTNN
jgi:hypothetical protein